ncbi:MAG TPA: RsmE family RNA methyltransferase [Gemmatimonadaceae bacterium]|nr:RsmE family RNA methyltransferase [Gemmatimonadaceae bacterium]
MERDDLASLAGVFFDERPLVAGDTVHLSEEAAHHMRVRRLEVGARVYLADGAGHHAVGTVTHLAKREASVLVSDVARVARAPDVHLMVPVADRDRMMWLAEKATELGVTSWRPVSWRRSRSVSPRGEGASFAARVAARMQSALLQSRASWLPAIGDDALPDAAIAALPAGGSRLVLDPGGAPVLQCRLVAPVTIAVGPEGGLEPDELSTLTAASFHPVSLGANVLRFETAAVAALAIVRNMLDAFPTDTWRTDG